MAAEGFIGRWSRLKRGSEADDQATEGKGPPRAAGPADLHDAQGTEARRPLSALPDGKPAIPPPVDAGPGTSASDTADVAPLRNRQGMPSVAPAQAPLERPPLPAIDSLDKDSDYSMFMRADVDPGLRLTALKRLFSDPHFNQMDGLDTYIDDYSKPDPLPLALLRRLDQSRILGLSAEEPAVDGRATGGAGAGSPAASPGLAGDSTVNDDTAVASTASDDTAVASTASDDTAVASTAGDDTAVASTAGDPIAGEVDASAADPASAAAAEPADRPAKAA